MKNYNWMPVRRGDHSTRREDAPVSKAASWRSAFWAAANVPNNASNPTLIISWVDIMRRRVKNSLLLLHKFRTSTCKVSTYIQQQWITPTQPLHHTGCDFNYSFFYCSCRCSLERRGTRLQLGRAGKMFLFWCNASARSRFTVASHNCSGRGLFSLSGGELSHVTRALASFACRVAT